MLLFLWNYSNALQQIDLKITIILASTKSDNPLYIYVVFYIKIYPNRPPCKNNLKRLDESFTIM
ncbi:hypothetical protein BpHYR1_005154 [Brachionus plicatilis]|uniref:Uncharacterized protein n=1 Tax=Brachionus plicatilis TaxID=10195 RepID=A0A3M7SP54_BRAPC|nr:hypothetical protein BpHYR1_005154 [Brachionus plicatilis]